LVAQGTSTTPVHYYLYEFGTEDGDTGACIIEIRSDSAQSPGPEFQEVTVEGLHSRGYLTYNEQVQLTPHQNINSVSPSAGFEAASWADTVPTPPGRPPWKKYVWAGSKTIRPYSGPWYLECIYRIDGRIVGHYRLFSQCGDGDIVQWVLGFARGSLHTHWVRGEHAFEYPPEAVIVTEARYVDRR